MTGHRRIDPTERALFRRSGVLASVDGSALGQVGASQLMRSLPDPDQVEGIVTVSELGARTRGKAGGESFKHATRETRSREQ